MNRSNGPISPLSMNSTESGFVSRYGNLGQQSPVGTPPNEAPYNNNAGPYANSRPPPGGPSSPPTSQHPSGSTDMSRPSASGSSVNGQRPPSSASSVGARSEGRPGPAPPGTERRPMFRPEHEEQLHKHYLNLRQYLASSLRDEKGNIRPNRARDKLLRLSVTQFMELSTDVFDELIRREDERLQRVKDVPRFLLPKTTFHPKRNQARQKLSTLPLDRFRQLATDVFYELERRIPRFANGDSSRPPSSASSISSRRPSQAGMRPPPMPGYRGPPMPNGGRPPMSPGPNGPNGPNGAPIRPPGSGRQPSDVSEHMPLRPLGSHRVSESSDSNSLGRPLPKTFQSNTIVPNKSTMVEDDDEEEEPTLGNQRFSEALASVTGSEQARQTIKTQETELTRLREELSEQITIVGNRGQWDALRDDLEKKANEAERVRENMQREIDIIKREKDDEHEAHLEQIRDLEDARSQLDRMKLENENLHAQNEDLQKQMQTQQAELHELREQSHHAGSGTSEEANRRIELLEEQLATQEKLTNEVKEEATLYLREMRDLSQQNDSAIEQEDRLAAQVTKLEREVEQWRERYAKAKAQNKALRASTLGLGLSSVDMGNLSREDSFISRDGLVSDVDITRFQLSVDELLKSARQLGSDSMLESVKQVTLCVSAISSTVGTDGYPTPSPSPHSPTSAPSAASPSVAKLKARVMGTANSLITATKQHASACGLSPVALLDAAASNLTAAVVELVKAVGVRPSSASELQDANADLDSIYSPDPSYPSPSIDLVRSNEMNGHHHNADSPPVQPLNVGNGQQKKANGWFGWGKGTSVDGSPRSPPSADEYDPYR
jgi:hypothetical protein